MQTKCYHFVRGRKKISVNNLLDNFRTVYTKKFFFKVSLFLIHSLRCTVSDFCSKSLPTSSYRNKHDARVRNLEKNITNFLLASIPVLVQRAIVEHKYMIFAAINCTEQFNEVFLLMYLPTKNVRGLHVKFLFTSKTLLRLNLHIVVYPSRAAILLEMGWHVGTLQSCCGALRILKRWEKCRQRTNLRRYLRNFESVTTK